MSEPSQDEVGSPSVTDSTEGPDSAPDNTDSPAAESNPNDSSETEEQVEPSVRDLLRGEVGLDDDEEDLIQLVVDAETQFQAGNFRAAKPLFGSAKDRSPSPNMAAFVDGRLRRIRPDTAALVVAALCGLALVVIWILAVGHSH